MGKAFTRSLSLPVAFLVSPFLCGGVLGMILSEITGALPAVAAPSTEEHESPGYSLG